MYGKHFASMYSGSMVGAGLNVFAVWGYVIANAQKGDVELNPKLLALILGCKEEEIVAAIDYLSQPDLNSRCKDFDGRRLIRDGQFLYKVPTHTTYRSILNEDERREYNRRKQAEHRAKYAVKEDVNDGQSQSSVSAHTEAEAEAEAEREQRHTSDAPAPDSPAASPAPKTLTAKDVVDAWNSGAESHGLSRVLNIGGGRARHLKARLSEKFWRENYRKALNIIPLCSFLLGKGPSGWRASFDWFIKPDSVAAIIEGKYRDIAPPAPPKYISIGLADYEEPEPSPAQFKAIMEATRDMAEGRRQAAERAAKHD